MWQHALWGLLGAAANVGVIFVEAARRAKGWPWVRPAGPGGGVYAVSVIVNLFVAVFAAAAVSTTGALVNGLYAFGVGVAAPTIVKKVARYAQSTLPVASGEGNA